jgi:hypothetical protein
LGQYERARQLGEDTLTHCRRVLGDEHPRHPALGRQPRRHPAGVGAVRPGPPARARFGVLTGYTNGVISVAFSPDGRTLATASTARLWETSIDSVAARICSITPAITMSEWERYLPGLAYLPPCS